MEMNSDENLLATWADDSDIAIARGAVDTEITAEELANRVTKMFYPY
jgi:hypothetical protein